MRKLFPLIGVAILLLLVWALVSQAAPSESGPEEVLNTSLRQTTPVTISIDPPTSVVSVGSIFTVDIEVASGTEGVDAVQAYLNFDPDCLRVVDEAGDETEEIIPITDALDTVVKNRADNPTGQIDYVAVTLGPTPTGTFDLASIRFKAITGTTTVSFNLTPPRQTKATQGGRERALSTSDGRVEMQAKGALRGQVSLQDHGPTPSSRWEVTLTVKLLHCPGLPATGGTGQGGSVVDTITTRTDPSGVFTLTDIAVGSYNVWVKQAHTLANRQDGVTISGGETTVQQLGTLLEGDANDDNQVGYLDLLLLARYWDTYQPSVDFNADGLVDDQDLSLLQQNYDKTGAAES